MLLCLRYATLTLLLTMGAGVQAQTVAPIIDPTAEALSNAAHESPHAWQASLPKLVSEAYFTNLKDGEKIETPFLVKFGLSGGWGLAPVSTASKGKAGHHHMLVNRQLPLDFQTALPFTDQYIHFGKGQMEGVLTLEPGKYTLRLLLANQKHLPYFVYSKPTTITVTKKNGTDPTTLQSKGIDMLFEEGTAFKTPFRIQFHASSLNVGHLSQQAKDSGHFRLTLTPKKGAPAVMDFVNGQSEVWLNPPAGGYQAKLELMDNTAPGTLLATAVSKDLIVK